MVCPELPTVEAAQAFAAYGRFADFQTLFGRIEDEGFPLGIEGRLRALTVLARLEALGVAPTDPDQLAGYLVPVLSGSKHQQDAVRRVIDEWAHGAYSTKEKTITPRSTRAAAAPRAAAALAQADRGGTTLAVGLAAFAVFGVIGLVLYSLFVGGAPDAATAARSVVTYSQPMVSFGADFHPFWKALIDDVVSRLVFAAVVLLAGLSFATWRHETRGRLARQTAETNLIERFAFTTDLPDWFRSIDARTAFDRLKRVRLFDTELIDVSRTVAKAVRAGGVPIDIVKKQQRELPNYVLLVDRAGRDDLEGIFASALEAALIEARIVYSRYDFSGGLDRLNPVRRGFRRSEHGTDMLGKDIIDAEYLPFSVIASRHAGERLILMGTGTGFFETPGLRYDSEGNETLVRAGTPLPVATHLREFGATTLITPSPMTAWGENEHHLRTRLGVEVFFSDVGGIRDLAARLMSEPGALAWAAPHEQTGEDRFLAWLDHNAMRLTSQLPPPGAEIDRLVRNLKAWAGEPKLYTLIATIAAFPKINPTFTFVLADMVLGEKKLDSVLFSRLVRLPWIRAGYMPDWLRIALVNALAPQQRKDAQTALLALLKGIDQTDQEGRPPSRAQLLANLEVARELPSGTLVALLARISPRNVLSADERIFFSALRDNYRLDPERDVIEPEAPEIVAAMIDAPERRRRGQIRLAVIGLAALAVLLQPWISVILTAGARAMFWGLQYLGELLPLFVWIRPDQLYVAANIFLLVAITQWLAKVTRRLPIDFAKHSRFARIPGRQWLLDARVPSCVVVLLGLGGLARPTAIQSDLVADAILVATGCGIFIWASLIASERWWNADSADDKLQLQLDRDPVTGTLGTLFVVAIWAVPWFVVVLPILQVNLQEGAERPDMLAVGACAGLMSWTASNFLARRWLLGEAIAPLHRLLIDAGFALLVFLILASIESQKLLLEIVFSSFKDASDLDTVAKTYLSAAAYIYLLRATLGLRGEWRTWGPIVGATIALVTFLIASFFFGPLLGASRVNLMIPTAVVGGLAYGTVAGGKYRLSSDATKSTTALKFKTVGRGLTLLLVGISLGHVVLHFWSEVLSDLEDTAAPRSFPPPSINFGAPLALCILPAALLVWPTFRLLASSSRLVAPTVPLWRSIIQSPWWAMPVMWFVGIIWHTGVNDSLMLGSAVASLWPLTFPIAMWFWYRHQKNAFVPLVLGTLPFILQLGSTAPAGAGVLPYAVTPGGVWPAIAILFLARFAGDKDFRARVLRRERLMWIEALLIIAMLSVRFDLDLWSWYLPRWFLGGALFPSPPLTVALLVSPSIMLVAVAAVLGASRMPVAFFAFAVIAAWLGPVFAAVSSDAARTWISMDSEISIGLKSGEAMSVLLVLFGAQAWRTYAASGVGVSPLNRTTGKIDARLTRMKSRGVQLACAAVAFVSATASGLVPAVQFDLDMAGSLPIALKFVPDVAGTLALVLFTGLVAGNLWTDRVVWGGRLIPLQITLFLDRALGWFSRFAIGALGIALLYLIFATQWQFTGRGIGTNAAETIPRDLGAIGFAACVLAYLLCGIALRVFAERGTTESWRVASRRLWSANKPPTINAPSGVPQP